MRYAKTAIGSTPRSVVGSLRIRLRLPTVAWVAAACLSLFCASANRAAVLSWEADAPAALRIQPANRAASARVLGAAATPADAVTTNGTFINPPPVGEPFVSYDTSTGDAVLRVNGYVPPTGQVLIEVDVLSSTGSLNLTGINRGGVLFVEPHPNVIYYENLGSPALPDGLDLGAVLPITSDPNAVLGDDFSSAFYITGQVEPVLTRPLIRFIAAPTPEPTSFSLIGLAAAGLLRRNRQASK